MSSLLIGETYLHKPTGRLLILVDHEFRASRRSGARKRTDRVVVRTTTGASWMPFVVKARDLGERPSAG